MAEIHAFIAQIVSTRKIPGATDLARGDILIIYTPFLNVYFQPIKQLIE